MSTSAPSPTPPARRSIVSQLLAQQPLAEPNTPFTGQTIIVTGANSGLGLAAATKLAALDTARVVLAVRNPTAGAAAQNTIAKRTGRQGCTEVWLLDMDSFASIRAFAQRAAAELDRLDGAVLNAGVYAVDYRRSAGGWEETLQVNTLSTVLLAVLLVPKLRESARQVGKPRVLEMVTSRRVEAVDMIPELLGSGSILKSLNDLDGEKYDPSKQYRMSKFLVMCAVQKLAGMVNASEITVTAVCPGAVATNLSRGWTGLVASLAKAILNALIMRTPDYAARTLVSGMLLGPEGHGKFWYDDEIHKVSLLCGHDGQQVVDRVWAEIVEILAARVPEVKEAIEVSVI